jgi:Bacterial membrane protein YfhO
VVYAASVALTVALARRSIGSVPRRFAVGLALLPLVFTGKAMLFGELYGPADLYRAAEPWRRLPGPEPVNPILSDLAFANLPWRAAVRDALVNGHPPLWNRFVLAGSPLLGTGQAAVLHPATWLGIALPVPLSFTFSCTYTLFLALLSAFLFFRDFRLSARAALAGAAGWGFSTYVVFWVGWSVGPATATFPLLLLGLRRLAREPSRGSIGLTAAALWLSFCGGHPESFFHGVAAASVYFVWELFPRRGARAAKAVAAAVGAGLLAFLLCGPQLFPLLESIPHSAEYRARRAGIASGSAKQSVPVAEAAKRLLPDILPFAHGIYGKSPVDVRRDPGSGMPLGYAGAVLFPLAALAFVRRPDERGRAMFLGFTLAGLAYGASTPVLMDLTQSLPGFAMALNYRLVFLAGLGLSGLAAFGVQSLSDPAAARRLAVAAGGIAAALAVIFLLARPSFAVRSLPSAFVSRSFLFEIVPVLLLGAGATLGRRSPLVVQDCAAVCLVLQRCLEMQGTYPTLPAVTLAPRLPTLAAIPLGSDPARVVAEGATFRPNASALYGLEDSRGYESLVLDRIADTFPLWCKPQPASFNRVDDLSRPFLSLLNVRWALAVPDEAAPPNWSEQIRGPDLAVFENVRALPRAFVPRRLRREGDARRRLEAMASEADFGETAWLSESGDAVDRNGEARVLVRGAGADLVVSIDAESRVFLATSLPDWPGWIAEENGVSFPTETANHAFVGAWIPSGRHVVRFTYRPASWRLGLASLAAGAVAAVVLTAARMRQNPA